MWMQIEGLKLLSEMTAKYNVEFIGGMQTVPEAFLSMKDPVKSVADLKGKKIRTAGDDGVIFSRFMGVSVVFLPATEIVESARRGVIDGFQVSSPGTDWTFGTYDAIKYLYLGPTRQPQEWLPIMINKKTWAGLPDSLKVLMTEMGKGSAFTYYTRMTQEDLAAIPKFQAKGVTVGMIPKDIEEAMVKGADTIYGEYSAKDPFFKKVFDSYSKFRDTYRATYPRM